MDDARAAMALFRMQRVQWEKDLRARFMKPAPKQEGKSGGGESESESDGDAERAEKPKRRRAAKRPRSG